MRNEKKHDKKFYILAIDMAKNEDFDEQCQTLLRANSGINFSGFWEFLTFILNQNILYKLNLTALRY